MCRLVNLLCVAGTCALLTACATAFQPKGATGGYETTAFAPDTYEVVFRGNGYTTEQRARDFALLEAADLTLSKDFQYFQIAGGGSRSKTQALYLPQYTTTSATAYGNTVVAHTTSSGGFPIAFRKPIVDLMVRMYHEKPTDGFTFDAAFLKHSIDTKYDIKHSKPPGKPYH